jgi:hypothetical protein
MIPWNRGRKGVMPEPWNKGLKGYNAGEKSPSWKGGLKKCLECDKKLSRNPGKSQLCWNCFIKNRKEHEQSNWKGNDVGYYGLHDWIKRKKGTPQKCDKCGDISNRKYEWANKTGKYKRVLSDWMRVCTPCHRRYDYKNGIIKPEELKRQ